MTRLRLRHVIMIMLLASLAAGPAAPTRGADVSALSTADQLVEQLGSQEFIRRQLATEALMQMGVPALDAVKRGAEHPDAEVRFRSRQVLRTIRHLDRQRLISAFATGRSLEAAGELPGWEEFRALAGDGSEARSLYVDMLDAEWGLLEGVFCDASVQPTALLAERCQGLQNSLRLRRTIPVGSVAALLLVASRDDVDLSSQPYLMSFCYLRDFERAVRVGSNKHALRSLLGTLVERDSADALLTQRLHFALHYDLTAGIEPARRTLASRDAIANVKQYAILVLIKLGTEDDLTLIEPLLEDATVIASHHRVNNVRIETQIRDLALAALLHRGAEDFAAYGLPPLQPHPTTVFNMAAVGFPTEEAREKAIAQWHQKHAAEP